MKRIVGILAISFWIGSLREINQELFLGEKFIADYLPVDSNGVDKLFFWLFLARNHNEKAPFIVFLNGGPGSSGITTVFEENGPYRINRDLSLRKNEYSYNNLADVMYIDQPICTGLSTCSSADRIPVDQNMAAKDLIGFFRAFYQKYPQYKKRPTYFTGQSFAGHYIPGIVPALIENVPDMNVKGVSVGNGAISFELMAKHNDWAKFGLKYGLINKEQYEEASKNMEICYNQLSTNSLDLDGIMACQFGLAQGSGGKNVYDYNTPCVHPVDCYDHSRVYRFLERRDVRDTLQSHGKRWVTTSSKVNDAMILDNLVDYSSGFTKLLDLGIPVMVYYGELDYICNYIGGWNWIIQLDWSHKGKIAREPEHPLRLKNRKQVGWFKRYGLLTYIKLFNAGHFVTMDRPEVTPLLYEKLVSKGNSIYSITAFIFLVMATILFI